MESVLGLLRVIIGLAFMAVAVQVQVLALLFVAPSRDLRIRACNYFGKVVGPATLKISGSTVTIRGREHLDGSRPAIYVSNHTSILDIFLAMWLSPVGTVGVAKREVVYYPFFGQLYFLSGHLRIDRKHPERAIPALNALGRRAGSRGLSVFLWPEGTRSRDGRLMPFKKGVVHLAVQTGLPVVPVVVSGAHRAWAKSAVVVHPVDIDVQVLPAIDTSSWSLDHIDEALEALHACFREALPDDQQPRTSRTAA